RRCGPPARRPAGGWTHVGSPDRGRRRATSSAAPAGTPGSLGGLQLPVYSLAAPLVRFFLDRLHRLSLGLARRDDVPHVPNGLALPRRSPQAPDPGGEGPTQDEDEVGDDERDRNDMVGRQHAE